MMGFSPAALDLSLEWNELHHDIQASTLVGHSSSLVMVCNVGMEPDHSTD